LVSSYVQQNGIHRRPGWPGSGLEFLPRLMWLVW
jgi:hypothetical protein